MRFVSAENGTSWDEGMLSWKTAWPRISSRMPAADTSDSARIRATRPFMSRVRPRRMCSVSIEVAPSWVVSTRAKKSARRADSVNRSNMGGGLQPRRTRSHQPPPAASSPTRMRTRELNRSFQVGEILAEHVPHRAGNRPFDGRQQTRRQARSCEAELDVHARAAVERLKRKHRVDLRGELVVRDRVGPVPFVGGDFHLRGIELAEHLARLTPPRPGSERPRRQHLNRLDA